MVNKKAEEPTAELKDLLDTETKTEDDKPKTRGRKPAETKPEESKDETPESPDEDTKKSDLTPEQEELQRLRAELEAEEKREVTNPSREGRPLAEEELTPEQKEIRILQDRLAQKRAENFARSSDVYDSSESVIVIHFVEDGFSAQGTTWFTGQTVSFGEAAYEQTKDRYGHSWLDLDEGAQHRRYGKVYFRKGPWEGATYEDDVAKADQVRGTAAPIVSF